MAKSLVKSPDGMALVVGVTNDVRKDLCLSKRQHGRDAIQNLVLRWILACLYYVSHENDKAESLWAKYNFVIKGKPVPKAALVFWGLSKGVDISAYGQLIEAILLRARAYSKKGSAAGHQFAFVMALMALSCCVTIGLHRTPPGVKILTRLRLFFSQYWVSKVEWEWIVKHAHVSRHDFVGLLSVLLTHTPFAPSHEMAAVMPRQYGRKVA